MGTKFVSSGGGGGGGGNLTPGSGSSGWTPGSIPFASGAGILVENNSSLFWDNTNGQLKIVGVSGTLPPLRVQAAPSQTADLAEWRDAAGNRRFRVMNNGRIVVGPDQTLLADDPARGLLLVHDGNTGPISTLYLVTSNNASGGHSFFRARGTAAAPADVVAGDRLGEIAFRGWRGGAFRDGTFMHFDVIGVGATSIDSTVVLESSTPGSRPLTLKAASGQTANLFELQDSTGTVLGGFDNTGRLRLPAGSASFTSLSIIGSPDTGLFSPAGGGLAATVGGLVIWRIAYSAGTRLLSFFGATPAAQQSVTALTDSTGGTPSDTISAAPATYDAATFNNILASLTRKINQIRTALAAYGLVV